MGQNFLRFARVALRLAKSEYGIAAGYRHRRHSSYFDDTSNKDEWQREVYQRTQQLMLDRSLLTVADIGCGSGFKLLEYLGEFESIGVEIEPTLMFLRSKYPNHRWVEVGSAESNAIRSDLVICADVVEHVDDPDELLAYLGRTARELIVISTPARDLLYDRPQWGPPANPTHLREWTFEEFGRYVRTKFEVLEHVVSNKDQWTQMVVCKAPSSAQ